MFTSDDVVSMLITLRRGCDDNARKYIKECLQLYYGELPEFNEYEKKQLALYNSGHGSFTNKINAIKSFRERTGVGLKTANEKMKQEI